MLLGIWIGFVFWKLVILFLAIGRGAFILSHAFLMVPGEKGRGQVGINSWKCTEQCNKLFTLSLPLTWKQKRKRSLVAFLYYNAMRAYSPREAFSKSIFHNNLINTVLNKNMLCISSVKKYLWLRIFFYTYIFL